MTALYSYNKTEKLKSRKALTAVFAEGKSFSVFPVKVLYVLQPSAAAVIKTGVGVSARNFKKAVDRNRIKRLLRECYRLNKLPLHTATKNKQQSIDVFFLYLGKELPDYLLLTEKMQAAIKKLEAIIG